jgi:hypothetical protein
MNIYELVHGGDGMDDTRRCDESKSVVEVDKYEYVVLSHFKESAAPSLAEQVSKMVLKRAIRTVASKERLSLS